MFTTASAAVIEVFVSGRKIDWKEEDHPRGQGGLFGKNSKRGLTSGKTKTYPIPESKYNPNNPADSWGIGDQGEGVMEVQRMINKWMASYGKAGVAPDGYFGTNTSNAVKAIQFANGLEVDGLVGPNTLKLLVSEPPKKTPKKLTEAERKEIFA